MSSTDRPAREAGNSAGGTLRCVVDPLRDHPMTQSIEGISGAFTLILGKGSSKLADRIRGRSVSRNPFGGRRSADDSRQGCAPRYSRLAAAAEAQLPTLAGQMPVDRRPAGAVTGTSMTQPRINLSPARAVVAGAPDGGQLVPRSVTDSRGRSCFAISAVDGILGARRFGYEHTRHG